MTEKSGRFIDLLLGDDEPQINDDYCKALTDFIDELMERRDKIKTLADKCRENPYDVALHSELVKLYLLNEDYENAEEHEEILEYLDVIRRRSNKPSKSK